MHLALVLKTSHIGRGFMLETRRLYVERRRFGEFLGFQLQPLNGIGWKQGIVQMSVIFVCTSGAGKMDQQVMP